MNNTDSIMYDTDDEKLHISHDDFPSNGNYTLAHTTRSLIY